MRLQMTRTARRPILVERRKRESVSRHTNSNMTVDASADHMICTPNHNISRLRIVSKVAPFIRRPVEKRSVFAVPVNRVRPHDRIAEHVTDIEVDKVNALRAVDAVEV